MSRSSSTRRWASTYLVALAALFVLSAATAAQSPATIVVGGSPVNFVAHPYVDRDNKVWAPVDAVHLLGADFTPAPDGHTVSVNGADGRQATLPCTYQQGHFFVDIEQAAQDAGAVCDWDRHSQTLTIRATLEMVRQDDDQLSIYTSYPVYYQVQKISHPDRVYVDLHGLSLGASPAAVPVGAQAGQSGVTRIRTGQLDFNTVRITLDLQHGVRYKVMSAVRTNHVQVAVAPSRHSATSVASAAPAPIRTAPAAPVTAPPPAAPIAVAQTPGSPSAVAPVSPLPVAAPPVAPAADAAGPVQVTGIQVKQVSDNITQVVVTATGPAQYRTEMLDNPDRLAFDLTNASFDPSIGTSIPGEGSLIKTVRSGIMQVGADQFGRVVLDLAKIVGFSVIVQPSDSGVTTYLINLQEPRALPLPSDGNSLFGAVVVIDPGHGGKDTGAQDVNGVIDEKNIALAIALKLRDNLTRAGATVFMTRDDDTFIPVMGRPAFAIAHGADYFISVHCDSSGAQNSHTGTTVYFHADNGVCRRMAQDILARVSAVSGIPASGVRSDTVRFASGFGVLRGSPMPAVLVECGYMNNDDDLAKLQQDAVQENIAEGIAAGLRDFVADRETASR